MKKRGSEGGHARAAKLSPERRSEIARNAVKARWARIHGDEPRPRFEKRRAGADGLLYCYGCKQTLPLCYFRLRTVVPEPGSVVTEQDWDVNCQQCNHVRQAYYSLKKLAKTAGMDAVVKEMRRAEEAWGAKRKAYARLLAETAEKRGALNNGTIKD